MGLKSVRSQGLDKGGQDVVCAMAMGETGISFGLRWGCFGIGFAQLYDRLE